MRSLIDILDLSPAEIDELIALYEDPAYTEASGNQTITLTLYMTCHNVNSTNKR